MIVSHDVIYYESHVTIDPCEKTPELEFLVNRYEFKLAQLYMRKGDNLTLSDLDMFMTAHDTDLLDIHCNMLNLVSKLEEAGYVVRRYKIEAVIIDSRNYRNKSNGL